MNEELIKAIMQQAVPFFSGGVPSVNPAMNTLAPLSIPGAPQQSQGQGGMMGGLMKMLPMMGQGGGSPPNPWAGGGGGYMDAGSMPMMSMG